MFQAKAITPKGKWDIGPIIKALQQEVKDISLAVGRELQAPTSTWTNQPPVQYRDLSTDTEISSEIFISDKRYAWLNDGTGPRDIVSDTPMKFQVGYIAKTTPKVLGAQESKRFGVWVTTETIENHRIEPRLWVETIIEKWENELPKRVGNFNKVLDTTLKITMERMG